MRNAMDAQEVAVGWWPGDARYPKAAFYAYAHPAPDGFADAALSPPQARWDGELGEYLLDLDDVRSSSDPHGFALEFARSAFRHACIVCGWDPTLLASTVTRLPMWASTPCDQVASASMRVTVIPRPPDPPCKLNPAASDRCPSRRLKPTSPVN